MDITSIVGKMVAKKALFVACDLMVPGSSVIAKGVFRATSLFGTDKMAEAVGKLGMDKSLEIAGAIGGAEESVVDFFLDMFTD